jgi:hypothetical protein
MLSFTVLKDAFVFATHGSYGLEPQTMCITVVFTV